MMRRLFNISAALSLLLCVVVCVLWVRSYWRSDQLYWWRIDGMRAVASARGDVVMQLNLGDVSGRPADSNGLKYHRGMQPYSAPHYAVAYGPPETTDKFVNWQLGSLGWYTVRGPNGMRSATGVAPFWCIAAMASALPLGWTALRWRLLAALPWLRWRFSLRTLLIATTLVAVVLGIIAAIA
jgi:hypothetical protein